MWLAYVKGLKGPSPQIWMEWPYSATGASVEPLSYRLLTTAEETEGLTVLATRYAAPVQP
jgi:hypothetical protein